MNERICNFYDIRRGELREVIFHVIILRSEDTVNDYPTKLLRPGEMFLVCDVAPNSDIILASSKGVFRATNSAVEAYSQRVT